MTDTLATPSLQLPPWADLDRWETHQLPIYEEVVRRFEEGNRLVILDDPPGGGKSLLAYMVHRYFDMQSYYLVGTKQLQAQVADSLPGVHVIKGRANYIPLDVDPYTTEGQDITCADCDLAKSMCSYCNDTESCPYTVSKWSAAMSDLPCANYSYALGEWSGRSMFLDRDLVICDEADTLAEEVRKHVTVSVSQKWQRRLNLRPPAKKTVESAWKDWLRDTLPRIHNYLENMSTNTVFAKRDRATLQRLFIKMVAVEEDTEGWIYDYDTKRDLDEQPITFKPVVVDKIANNVLWSKGKRFLCMSASIGSPEAFVKELGYEDSWAPVFAPSTFPVERRPIYFVPAAKMTWKMQPEEKVAMCDHLAETLDVYSDRRTLVLPHTYPNTKMFVEYLQSEKVDRPIFYYLNANEREQAIFDFENTPEDEAPVLLAPSLGRGYDNPSLRLVVICKVPFPYLGDKQVDARSRMKDGKLWLANETAKTLIQSYGRSMRSETDEGVTVVLDSKFADFYGQWKGRLFPEHMREAVQMNSDLRWELRQRMKKKYRVTS